MTPAGHNNDNTVREGDLQAYVDDQLDGRQFGRIEAFLGANPVAAARIAAYRGQNIGLRTLFEPPPGISGGEEDEPLPPRVAALARACDAQWRHGAAPAMQPQRKVPHLAACVALLLSAGTAGWIALDPAGEPARITLASGQPPAADPQLGEKQVVAWLAAQPGGAPSRVPDLESLGFRLVAERIIKTKTGHPAAQLLYQNQAGKRVTLYMRSGGKAGQTSFTFRRDGDASQFFWQDSHMAYSLIGRMAQQELLPIAEAISRSLRGEVERPPAPEASAPLPERVEVPKET